MSKRAAYSREYYLKNRDRILERHRRWRYANPERWREIQKGYRERRKKLLELARKTLAEKQ